jgi:hypothetical protein
MSKGTGRKPNLVQYIGYCYGRVLPSSMRDWVRDDLTSKGATIRTMIRAGMVRQRLCRASARRSRLRIDSGNH